MRIDVIQTRCSCSVSFSFFTFLYLVIQRFFPLSTQSKMGQPEAFHTLLTSLLHLPPTELLTCLLQYLEHLLPLSRQLNAESRAQTANTGQLEGTSFAPTAPAALASYCTWAPAAPTAPTH